MKNYPLVFFLIIIFCNYSCQSIDFSEEAPFVIDADPEKAVFNFPLTSIFTDITYIPLETVGQEAQFGIGWIGKVIIEDDKIIIFENNAEESKIFIFDQNGRFLSKITTTGEGSGKLLAMHDILYDRKNENIEALDYYQEKIIRYSIFGELKEEIPIKHRFNSFVKFDDEHYFFYARNQIFSATDEPMNLWRVNGDEIQSFLPIPNYLLNYNMVEQNFSNPINGTYLFKNILTKEFYRISRNGSPVAEYQIDVGNKWVNEDVLNRLARDVTKEHRREILYTNQDHVYHIRKLLETEQYLFFTYYYQNYRIWNLYNKISHKNIIAKTRYNDLDQGMVGEDQIQAWTIYDDSIVFLIAANDFKFRASILKLPESHPFNEMAAKLDWEDNPIIAIAKLRKDIGQ